MNYKIKVAYTFYFNLISTKPIWYGSSDDEFKFRKKLYEIEGNKARGFKNKCRAYLKLIEKELLKK